MNKFTQASGPVVQTQAPDARAQQLMGMDHMFGLTAGAKLPLAMALITGALVGVAAMVLAWMLGSRVWWKWGLGFAVVAELVFWFIAIYRWFDLTKLENWFGMDLNRDGIVGKRETVRVEISQKNPEGSGRRMTMGDLPGSREQLRRMAQGLLRGVPCSERQWTGKGAPFSSQEFRMLRQEMIRRGLLVQASEKDTRQGFVLSEPEGVQVMERLAGE